MSTVFALEILNIDWIALFKLIKNFYFTFNTFNYELAVLLHKINSSGVQTLIN